MFLNCSSLKELNISNFKTIKVENMTNMLYNCLSLSKLDLSNLKLIMLLR